MKGATQCAKKVKSLFRTLRTRHGKVTRPGTGDPISQLILGVFTRDMPESRARDVLEKFRSMVVDYNELRVINAGEMATAIGDYPDVRIKCEDVSRALNRIFAIEHNVALDRLAGLAQKEMLAYLAGIPGLEPYTRARIRLLGLDLHAIPLDEAMWAYARAEGMVDSKSTLEDAQTFLERQVDKEEAHEFVALLRKQAWADFASPVRKGEVEKIRSVPPDRTTRNMLQMIASGGSVPEVEPDLEALNDASSAEPAAADETSAGGKSKGKAKPPAPKKAVRPAEKPRATDATDKKRPRESAGDRDRKTAARPARKSAKPVQKAGTA